MKLQILVPQYNEPAEVLKNLLDSIKIQQGIDFNDIEVLIGNDGGEANLAEFFLTAYPYSIQYRQYEHSGPAGTRQKLFDEATADYVMFCDADDMFLSVLALYTIFAYLQKGVDALVVDFIEEIKDRKTGRINYFVHHNDDKFVHGKVYRRRHLIDNKIVWYADIEHHEDSAYNLLALGTAKVKDYCKQSLYLWKWRDESICRADPLYVLKTYPRMIYSNANLVTDFISRNLYDKAKFHLGVLVYNTYYMLNSPAWLDPMNAKYRYETEKCFKEYYAKFKDLFNRINPDMRNQIISGIKRRVMSEGITLEKFTFDEWIDHIEELD